MFDQPDQTPRPSAESLSVRLRNATILALGVVLATITSPYIQADNVFSLIVAVLLITFLNSFLKPLLVLFALPFVVLTLGIGLLIINAMVLWIVGNVGLGFTVDGFWAALWGALVISGTQLICHLFLSDGPSGSVVIGGRRDSSTQRRMRDKDDDDDVIDV